MAPTGAYEDGRLHAYPLADLFPELAAIRWARRNGAEVLCCDLPLAAPPRPSVPPGPSVPVTGGGRPPRDGPDPWDRTVEARAPGSSPEAVRLVASASAGRCARTGGNTRASPPSTSPGSCSPRPRG